MKRKKIIKISVGVLAVTALVVGGALAVKHRERLLHTWHRVTGEMTNANGGEGMDSSDDSQADKYQCSMHPSVVSDNPGQCPICAMDLQAVKKIDAKGIVGRSPVELDSQQRQLINIRTIPARKDEASRDIRTVGVLHHDASKVFTIAAWTDGRIEKLFVDKPETDVRKGDLLYSIYSPELYASTQDYLDLSRAASPNEPLLRATRNRLKLLGLSDRQLTDLEKLESAPTAVETLSPAAGKVMMKMIKEGDYVKTGQMLYSVVDLSTLWLIVTIYEPELGLIQPGMKVVATTTAYPGEEFVGSVTLVNHQVNKRARSVELRVEFQQADHAISTTEETSDAMKHRRRLLPGMYMDARLQIDLGEQLLIPAGSVFDTGKRQYVFVEQSEGLFVPREIQAGHRTGTDVVVDKGLDEGDRVVVDGNFLLDSESQLKAAASGDGADATAAESGIHMTESIPLPFEAGLLYEPLLKDYAAIQSALAEDKLDGVTDAVERMREQIGLVSSSTVAPVESAEEYRNRVADLKTKLGEFEAADIETARLHFGHVSGEFTGLIAHFPPPLKQALNVASCPMWTRSSGRWLQTGDEIVNPYMGQKMLRCGEILQKLEPPKTAPTPAPLPAETRNLYRPAIETMIQLSATLSTDKPDADAASFTALAGQLKTISESQLKPASREGDYHALLKELEGLLKESPPREIAAQRILVGNLNDKFIQLLTEFPPPLDRPIKVVKCGMWKQSPDRWLQFSESVANPFYGSKMLSCGSVTETLGGVEQ